MSWKYYVDSVEVFPYNSGNEQYSFEKKKITDVFLTRVLKTEITFDSRGAFDFKTQDSTDPSEELEFIIKRKCEGVYVDFFKGLFSVSEGQFDDDRCTFSITPRSFEDFFQSDLTVDFFGGITPLQNSTNIGVFVDTPGEASRNYVNAFTFDSVILSLARKIDPRIVGIKSDFFQINPDVVSADCLPGVPNVFTKMAFCALSDVQEPIPSNLSTYNPVKFSDLMDDLNVLFDVYFFIDDNYNLRIEHLIYFDGAVWLDLTDAKYKDYVKGQGKYKYNNADYPRAQSWKFIDSKQFARIEYDQISSIKRNSNEINLSTKVIRTDYVDIRYVPNNHVEYGLFLFATYLDSGAYQMISGSLYSTDFYGIAQYQNYVLTPEFLIKNLHTYDRPYLHGLLNSSISIPEVHYGKPEFIFAGGFIAQSSVKSKIYEPVIIPLCCEDAVSIQSQVNTERGIAYVSKADYSAKSETLNLELKYKNPVDIGIIPTDLTGCDLWLRRGVGLTLSGSLITQWDDQSGNGRHAVGSGGNKPTWDSGKGAMNLFGATAGGKFLTTPAFQMFPSKRGTVFMFVWLQPGVTPDAVILSTNDAGPGVNYWDVSWDGEIKNLNEGIKKPMNNFYLPGNVFVHKGLYCINRFANTLEKFKHNGLVPLENTAYNPQTVGNNQPLSKPLIIGYNANISPFVPVTASYLYEVIVYNRSLSDKEMKQIEFYFARENYFEAYP